MKKNLLNLVVVGVAACAAVIGLNSYQPQSTQLYETLSVEETQFMDYVTKFRKSYGTKEEYNFRLE